MQRKPLRQLYLEEVKYLYGAESKLVKWLPKLSNSLSDQELCQILREHVRQTQEHTRQIEVLLKFLEEPDTAVSEAVAGCSMKPLSRMPAQPA